MLTLTIHTDGAAFGSDPAPELARILRDLADSITKTGRLERVKLQDINGNTVGSTHWEDF